MDALFSGLPERIPLVNFFNAHFNVFKMFCDKIIEIANINDIKKKKKNGKMPKRPTKYLTLLLAPLERLIVLNFFYKSKKSDK